jgi:nitrous oxide reductase accessory protein NosL
LKDILFACAIILISLWLAGCTQSDGTDTQNLAMKAERDCKDLCNMAILAGNDLSRGPCLANSIVTDWSCDIAHNPRDIVDDKPENQCSSFRGGNTHHFVELDIKCNLIRKY